ncbi:hypothetical protein P7D52_08130 [Enterococcus dongliensis]|uniref:Uncharacterized protein n=1 Tax=Enterococcus dongliensis TaxID=2559925 RepID=A0AAW8TJ40_9ENTE|nr:hypothetical protein [Enterococcus dongliensis]MDT2635717.1 hypothetical protein [Enterococcus dongliensis]MDT2637627.1 hypothetical protein [Enterococcus dongliensis]MDT2642753.1 hypothetical protein [Enterococcus dongliensis]
MKTIYKVLYPIGYEVHEVADDFPVLLPFVAVLPLELENPQSQFFNFAENKWEEAITQDYSEKLELLENLSAGLQVDNTALKESNAALTAKTDSMAQLNAKLMLNDVAINREIETLKTQIGGAANV